MLLVLLAVFIRGWRRNPGSPVMLMFLCTTLIVWQDPIMNWSPFAVYNPDLIHWPESWPLVSISPSVEPFVVFGYVMFYFGPYFPAVWILRKLQARRGPQAFVSRHPLWSLGLLTLVIGFVFDAWLEIQLVHSGMYIYSQVIPVGFGVHRYDIPIPADLGVVLGVLCDDSRRRYSAIATTPVNRWRRSSPRKPRSSRAVRYWARSW